MATAKTDKENIAELDNTKKRKGDTEEREQFPPCKTTWDPTNNYLNHNNDNSGIMTITKNDMDTTNITQVQHSTVQ